MKTILQFTLLAFVFFGGVWASKAQEKFTINVGFTGMKTDQHQLYVAVYDNEADFLKKRIKGMVVKVENLKASTVLELPAGVYAISCFYDLNDNKQLDTNFWGIPKEPIGISNDAKGFMGPPKYKDAKFTLNENRSLTITINE